VGLRDETLEAGHHSVLYSISMVLLLTAVGLVVFRQSLNYFELAGIVLAIASLTL
jgi:multidrug transporter EmrE-like cation transporter